LRHAETVATLRSRNALLESEMAAQVKELQRLRQVVQHGTTPQPAAQPDVTALELTLAELRNAQLDERRSAREEAARLKRQLSTSGAREAGHQAWERNAQILYLFCQRQALLGNAAQLVFLVEGLAEEVRVMLLSAQVRMGTKLERLLPGFGQQEAPLLWREYLSQRNREYGKWKHSYRQRLSIGTADEVRKTALQALGNGSLPADPARLEALAAQLQREGAELVEDVRYLVNAYETFSEWARGVRASRCFRLGELVVCQLVKLRLRPKNAGFLQRIESYDLVFSKWVESYRQVGPPQALRLPNLPRMQR
jgi:hypothetical protein